MVFMFDYDCSNSAAVIAAVIAFIQVVHVQFALNVQWVRTIRIESAFSRPKGSQYGSKIHSARDNVSDSRLRILLIILVERSRLTFLNVIRICLLRTVYVYV